MAKIYRAFDPPVRLDYNKNWEFLLKQEQEYIEQQAQKCRERHPNDEFAGELVRWSVADGYAQYLVLKSKPLSLIHLQLGDAYRLEPYAERGLQLRDIRKSVACRKQWEGLMQARA